MEPTQNVVFVIILTVFLVNCEGSVGKITLSTNASTLWERYGRRFNISCKVTGSRDTSIQWLRDSVPLVANEHVTLSIRREIKNDSFIRTLNLLIRNVYFTDAGNYTCQAGRKSKAIDVKVVKGRLKIFPKTHRIIVYTNEPGSLTCEYVGSEKVKLAWRKDIDGDVSDSRFTSNQRTIAGSEVTSFLRISKNVIEETDAGEYTCTAGPIEKSVIVEVHKGPCDETLVTGPYGVTDDRITASTYYEDTIYIDSPSRARLHTRPKVVSMEHGPDMTYGGGWAPTTSDKKQFIQVKFASQSVVRAIVTQGRASAACCNQSHWVKQFKVHYSQDGITWYRYKDQSGNLLHFRGNRDQNSLATNQLPSPVIARYIRILPTKWNDKIGLRFEVRGCYIPKNIRMVYPNKQFINLEVPDELRLTCEYTGPDKANITWYKDDQPLLQQHGFNQRCTEKFVNGRITIIASITKTKTEYSDSGKYTCGIVNTTITKEITIYAVKLDKIPNYDRLWTIKNTPLQLSCDYKSRDKREFTWQYENNHISKFGFDVNLESRTINGAAELTSSVSKTHIDVKDGGKYKCMIGGLERLWNIRVLEPVGNSSSQTLRIGETMYLDCDVKGLTDDVSYERFWTRDRLKINQIGTRGRMHYFPDAKTLQIIGTNITDAGRYECNILLEAGTPQQQQLVIVKELRAPPNATIEGQKIISSGDSLHLFCKVTGFPKPIIVWFRDGRRLNSKESRVTFLPYDGMDNGHLIIFNVNEKEAGRYVCKAETDLFPPSSSSLNVEVADVSMAENSTLVISLSVGGVVVLALVLLCGIYICCSRCRKQNNEYGYDTNSLERLRKQRPISAYTDESLAPKFNLVKLKEEPRLYPKKSCLKTVTIAEESEDVYQRVPNKDHSSSDDDVRRDVTTFLLRPDINETANNNEDISRHSNRYAAINRGKKSTEIIKRLSLVNIE